MSDPWNLAELYDNGKLTMGDIHGKPSLDDNCIVGRGLVNDALEGWSEPCQEPVTEEFIVPIGINPQTGITVGQDVWPFCQNHGKQFQQALHDAQEGACN